jgi:outer membrane protein OmpU
MKKLLIASTALVATAGMAAADVSLSGSAEMGIKDEGGAVGVEFHHDLDVKFSLSGETDGGISFGAAIDLDEVSAGIPDDSGPATVWIKGSFGNLTLGDTDGAQDWANAEINMLSTIDDLQEHAGRWSGDFLDGGNDGQILRYDNTFGDFGVAVSYEMDDVASNDILALGLKYTADLGGVSLGLGLGYQENDTSDATSLSVKTSFSGVDVVLNYADLGGTDYMGIGLGYTTGDLALHANYGEYDGGADGFAVVANYDLGGGASVQAGYADDSVVGGRWSLGLGMSF